MPFGSDLLSRIVVSPDREGFAGERGGAQWPTGWSFDDNKSGCDLGISQDVEDFGVLEISSAFILAVLKISTRDLED